MAPEQWRAAGGAFLRAVLALAAGAVTGVVLCLAIAIGPDAVRELGSPARRLLPLVLELEIGAMIATGFAAVICVVAPLAWWPLRRMGRDSWVNAAILGFGLTAAAWCLWDFRAIRHGGMDSIGRAVLFALAGAVAGWVTWRTAAALRARGRIQPDS